MTDTTITTTSPVAHVPVLRAECLEALAPVSGGVYADVTLGRGGHTEAILEASSPDGRVFALDRDLDALAESRVRLARFGDRVTYVHGAFSELGARLREHGVAALDGVLADLGVSSPQLDREVRGFSFRFEGPLDMRMDTSRGATARELCEQLDEEDLANVIYRYGEERRSRPIARAIKTAVRLGQMTTTLDLRRAVVTVLGERKFHGIDPATRTFQGLRIAVNDELGELESLLAHGPEQLRIGGVLAIISFHSLEDRMVKQAFRGDARLAPLTKRPVIATDAESSTNPRSRSAKLRAARRVTPDEAA